MIGNEEIVGAHLHNLNLIRITECFTNSKAACAALRNGAAFVRKTVVFIKNVEIL